MILNQNYVKCIKILFNIVALNMSPKKFKIKV